MYRNHSIYYTFGRSEGPKTDPESVRTSTFPRDGGKNEKKTARNGRRGRLLRPRTRFLSILPSRPGPKIPWKPVFSRCVFSCFFTLCCMSSKNAAGTAPGGPRGGPLRDAASARRSPGTAPEHLHRRRARASVRGAGGPNPSPPAPRGLPGPLPPRGGRLGPGLAAGTGPLEGLQALRTPERTG